jgi:monoamine oxidase
MNVNRREFAKLSGFALGGLSLSSDLTWAQPQAARTRSSNGKRIVVLGAGMAGLAAGRKLRGAGYSVIILEAQMHPGGRVHTIREGLSDDLYAEAGAGRIPRTHTVALEWIKDFGLELEPFHPASLAQVALLKGKRVKLSTDGSVEMSLVPLDLTPEERRIGLANLEEHYFGEATKLTGDRIREDWSPEVFDHLGEITASDFLRQKGASEDAIRYMLLGWEDNAAADYIKDVLNHNAAPLMKIKGGNDQLPRAIAGKLSDAIHYGCSVEHIERGEKSIRIAYRRAGMLDHVDAEAVICTIPYSVLRHIAVTPEWSPSKRNVIDNLRYSPAVRTTYQVRRRYWEDEGLNGFGTSDKDFEVWHPTFGKPGTRGILQAYNYEKYANHLDQLSESERLEQTIRDMDEVHPKLRQNLETVVIKSWATDPWQRGAYPFYTVGQIKWYADICKPEGGVWFAGDHASGLPGWIEGAITSGLKAAQEVGAKLEVAT